jgi:Flp pilus assembly protein TadB
MARQRNRAKQEQEQADLEHDAAVTALRKDGRAWLLRALAAVAFAAVVGLVSSAAIAIGTVVALVCIGLALRQGVRAQRLDSAHRKAAGQ